MLFNETGREVLGLKEYNYNGVRFIYKEGSGNLFCFFSSFSAKGERQSYNYIKKKDAFKNPMLWFLDSDSPNSDPRGTYFLGDARFSYLKKIKQIIEYFFSALNAGNIYYFGSSKGGTGAILTSLEVGRGIVVVNAPQIHFGSYMHKFLPPSISEVGMSVSSIDRIIEEKLTTASPNVKFVISCGVLDEYHFKEHLLSFVKILKAKEISCELWPIPGGHDGDALEHYQSLLSFYAGDGASYADVYLASECAQLAFYDRYSDAACFEVFSSIPFYNNARFDSLEDVKGYLLSKMQRAVGEKVESLFFSNSFLVKIPDLPGMHKCVYVVSSGKTYKAKKYQSSPEFKLKIPGCRPSSFRLFYKGNKEKFVFDGGEPKKTSVACDTSINNVVFVFVTRYSILSKNISSSWLLGQKPFDDYKGELFSPTRMNLRELLFKNVCLPSVRAQLSDCKNFQVRHLVLTSEELPFQNKEFLYNLKNQNKHLDILELPSSDTNISKSVASYLQSGFKDAYLITIRLDDDDAVSNDFCNDLASYVNSFNIGKVVSFGKGIAGIFDDINKNGFIDFKDYYYPKLALGLSHINYIDERGEFTHKKKSIFDQGSHTKVDLFSPLILDSRNIKYIRVFHAGSDSIDRHYNNVIKLKSMDPSIIKERFSISSALLLK